MANLDSGKEKAAVDQSAPSSLPQNLSERDRLLETHATLNPRQAVNRVLGVLGVLGELGRSAGVGRSKLSFPTFGDLGAFELRL